MSFRRLRTFIALAGGLPLPALAPPVRADVPGEVQPADGEFRPAYRPGDDAEADGGSLDDWDYANAIPAPHCGECNGQPRNDVRFDGPIEIDRADQPFQLETIAYGDPQYFPELADPRDAGIPPKLQGRGEVLPGDLGDLELDRALSSPLEVINDPSPWPYRPNCKLFMKVRDTTGTVYTFQCSGTLIDSKHIVTAGHCIYFHTATIGGVVRTFNTWAEEVRVIPAYNNGAEPYCYAKGLRSTWFTRWRTDRDFDYDVACTELDRPIGALTGWFGYGIRPACSTYTGETYFNRGYPASNPYNGQLMYDQSGMFDSCESAGDFFWTGNEVRSNTQSWGGQSGSSAYRFRGTSRTIEAILSNGTEPPGAWTQFACLDQPSFDLVRNYVNNHTPAAPDYVPLDIKADANQAAGRQLTGFKFLVHNYSSAPSTERIAVDIYLSRDRKIEPTDTRIGAGSFAAAIGPKSSRRVSGNQPGLIPANALGRYYVGVIVTTADSNGANNAGFECDVAQIDVSAVGACCQPNGTCIANQTVNECLNAGGGYQGAGTTCEPNPCPIIRGACCGSQGTCYLATQSECTGPQFIYFGDLTTCEMVGPICPNGGACCNEQGQCRISSQLACSGPGQVYLGDGIPCQPGICAPATQPILGACCDLDLACGLLSEADCADIGGTWNGAGSDCETVDCDPEVGACCINGQCSIVPDEFCLHHDGVYLGDNIPCPAECPAVTPTGACCQDADGICSIETAANCAALSGVYFGTGSTCEPFPCVVTRGACCVEGACSLLTQSGCTNRGGQFFGNDSLCENVSCPQPPTGACCLFNGACVVQSAAECVRDAGVYQGDGAACEPNPCPQPGFGACCLASGACVQMDEMQCQASDSLYLGDGTSCDAGVCDRPTGACCDLGGQCSLQFDYVCRGSGGRYLGDGSACTGPVCGVLGDMNCDGFVTVSDIGPFVLALTDPLAYAAQFPDCYALNGDFSRDGGVTVSDISAFVEAVVQRTSSGGGA